jgi:aspartate racemase
MNTQPPRAAREGAVLLGPRGIVGVLGGMGPLATIDFMRKVMAATPAATDQEHVPMIVSCLPQVPDRTAAFRREGESPVQAMVDSGRRLVDAGVGLVVMPCNTAHLWFDAVQQALGLPMIHLVDAALDDVRAAVGAGARIGLLATDATMASGLYLDRRGAQHAGEPVRWLQPTAREMLDWVMPGIAAVKRGSLPEARALLLQAARALEQRGAAAVVLGCTEIPVVLCAEDGDAPCVVIDATAALARRAVQWSLAQREERAL